MFKFTGMGGVYQGLGGLSPPPKSPRGSEMFAMVR